MKHGSVHRAGRASICNAVACSTSLVTTLGYSCRWAATRSARPSRRNRAGGPNCQDVDVAATDRADLLPRRFDPGEDVVRLRQQRATGPRQLDVAAGPAEPTMCEDRSP